MKKAEKTTTYKGFDKNLICREFQYEIGKTYEHKGDIVVCSSGFHSCINPIDVLHFYDPAQSRFCEVEISGKQSTKEGDSKIASEFIFIKRELSITEFISICADYIENNCSDKKENSGYSSMASNSGDSSMASNSGYSSMASNSGYRSMASNSGDRSMASNSGDSSMASNSGYRSMASNSGDSSMASNSGDSSMASNSGYRSMASNSGDSSMASNSGDKGVAVVTGYKSKAKAKIGNWIVVAERNDDWEILNIKTAKIDGVILKEDTYYMAINNEFVESN